MQENVIQIKTGITMNIDASVKSIIYVKSNINWILAGCYCENGKYRASVIDHLMSTWNEIKKRKQFQ